MRSLLEFLCLAQANMYVITKKIKFKECDDVSEVAAYKLRRVLCPSAISSLNVVKVILALLSLPCQSTNGLATRTTHLVN